MMYFLLKKRADQTLWINPKYFVSARSWTVEE